MVSNHLKVFGGRSNPELHREICSYLGIEPGRVDLRSFSDGETYCQIQENVRGADIFIVQSTCTPVNETLMELLVMIDAFKRASARRITAVLPYYGYARQDRKDRPRVPISAKLVADLIVRAGVDRVMTMDLHAAQIQGFFDVPHDHLYASRVGVDFLGTQFVDDLVIISPDAGGVERARAFGKRLKADLGIIDKRRPAANVAEVMNVIGEVEGRTCVIVDDIVDTAGTLCKVAEVLMEKGATKVLSFATHPVLSGPAVERIDESQLEKLIVTDTIPLQEKRSPKIKQLSVARTFGEAIKRTHEETSITSLFA
ncbi:MAG: ribose-phosphate pyrophosphokinase [Acidobacteriota bacterium]